MSENKNSLVNESIKKLAEEIRRELLGGKLYGQDIKEDDIDALIVAAYFLGEKKTSRKPWEEIEEIELIQQ